MGTNGGRWREGVTLDDSGTQVQVTTNASSHLEPTLLNIQQGFTFQPVLFCLFIIFSINLQTTLVRDIDLQLRTTSLSPVSETGTMSDLFWSWNCTSCHLLHIIKLINLFCVYMMMITLNHIHLPAGFIFLKYIFLYFQYLQFSWPPSSWSPLLSWLLRCLRFRTQLCNFKQFPLL